MPKQIEVGSVLVREDETIPVGQQMFWWRQDGKEFILCGGTIGVPVKGVRFNMLTLNPFDFELLAKSQERAKATAGGAGNTR
jgi:hypothetical protein